MVEGRTGNGILFKKVEKQILKVQTDKVNEMIKYSKSNSIVEMSNLIRSIPDLC